MKTLTNKDKSMIGMIHVQALPGTPKNKLSMKEIRLIAVSEAQLLKESGFDAIMLENMHDRPYLNRIVGPEIISAMTYIISAVRDTVNLPIGIQILAGANKEALAAAHICGCQFIRVEGFVFSHIADEGIMSSDAGELLRYRRLIGADNVRVFADIKKKHSSHSITADVNIAETANAAEFFGADAVIVTGIRTGLYPSKNDLADSRSGCSLPLIVGSGTNPDILPQIWDLADGFIVGSYIKDHGIWSNPIDPLRAKQIIQTAENLRKKDPKPI